MKKQVKSIFIQSSEDVQIELSANRYFKENYDVSDCENYNFHDFKAGWINNPNKYSEDDILKALIWMALSNWELTSTGWLNIETKEIIDDNLLLNKFKEILPKE